MQALRLNEVLTRVVAWHNRHPLARRIAASQVHSIGGVVLPFASAQPLPGGAPPPRLPTVAELLAAPENLFTPEPAPATAASPGADAAGTDPVDEDDGAPALEMPPVLTDAVSEPPPLDLSDGAPATDAAPAAAPSSLAVALARRASATLPATTTAAPAGPPVAPATGVWARLRARLPGRRAGGLPPLRAAFSPKFLWPLRPGSIARWARRHGQSQSMAPADWPRRVVETDAARRAELRRQGLLHDVPLHLLTAAIGVGDRRIRVLMDAQGAVIGPRAYSLPRIAVAGGVLLAALAGLAAGPLQPLWQPWLASAVDAPAPASSAPLPAAVAASAAASQAEAAASAPAPPAEAPAVAVAAVVSAPPPIEAASSATTPPAREVPAVVTAAAAPMPAPAPSAAAALPPAPPAPVAPVATAPHQDIRPQLSAEQRQAAREQAARLRGEAPPAAPAPATVYAVVGRPSAAHDAAARDLALMQAAAAKLPPPTPDHAELMRSQGQWRAAWWPFTSLADAERARIMLAGKGLKAEVVEF